LGSPCTKSRFSNLTRAGTPELSEFVIEEAFLDNFDHFLLHFSTTTESYATFLLQNRGIAVYIRSMWPETGHHTMVSFWASSGHHTMFSFWATTCAHY
jgi:hypothetical protein